jgi:glyoxylate reductase
MTKHIYMTRPIHEAGVKLLREKGYEITMGECGDAPCYDAIFENLKKTPYDAVVSFLTDKVDAALFDACPTAKLFSNYSVGFNNIDLDEARARGISITNTPGCAGRAVAEHTVALMLAVTTRMVEGDRYMRAGKYTGWQPELFVGTDLSGKTVGLIGLGDIGTQTAKMLAHGFGCTIIYTDLTQNEALNESCRARFVSKEELLATADIISMHVPLLPSTTHIVDAAAFALMKPSAIVINTARGPVIHEEALIKALTEKRIAGAGIDVYEFEPHVEQELLALENVVLTPHIASARESVRIKMAEVVAKNIISFFETGNVLTPVTHQ